MEVQLLKKDGKILFMETESAFADMLTRILQAPLGAVVGTVGGGPFAALQQSMWKLREPIFTTPKQKVLVKALDLESKMESAEQIGDDVLEPVCHPNITATSNERGVCALSCISGDWFPAAFTKIEGGSFEVVLENISQGSGIMLGIAPSAQINSYISTPSLYTQCGYYMHIATKPVLYSQGGTNNKPTGLQFSPGDSVAMKFLGGASPSLSFSMRDQSWTVATFNQSIPGNVPMCLVVVQSSGNCRVKLRDAPGKNMSALHPVAKFLISNELEICESSSLKAVQLLQKQNMELSALEVDTVIVTPMHVKRMLSRAFMGLKDVLHYAFGEDVPNEPPTEGSEQSFVMS